MALSARKVKAAGPGRHGDGRGLFLYVKPSGARSWVLRYQVHGRRRDLGLGSFPDVSLAMARDRASEARRLIAEGEDPIAKKQQAKPKTFKDAALELIESKRPGWKNAKHAAQWTSTLETYAFPKVGQVQVSKIENYRRDRRTYTDLVCQTRDRKPSAATDRSGAGLCIGARHPRG